MKRIIFLNIVCLIFSSCSKDTQNKNVLTQVNSFELFMNGEYDGMMSYRDILHWGDFGIGSFNQLNGEMILLDGDLFRISANGEASGATVDQTTPIATVCLFEPDITYEIHNLSYQEVMEMVNQKIPDLDLFYGIKIKGQFREITTRSIYKQEKPYEVLSEVIKNEVRRKSEMISGTCVGFKAPDHIRGAVWAGFHFHFIDDDKLMGGHVLDFTIQNGVVELDILPRLNLIISDETK